MKRFATLFVALGLVTAGSTVLAEEAKDQLMSQQTAKPQPVQMTEAQLDDVTAGLVFVCCITVPVNVSDVEVSVLERNQILVQAPIGAGVGAGVLGAGAGGGVAGAFGRQDRR